LPTTSPPPVATHPSASGTLEQIVAAFERAWRDGERPDIDAHLPTAEAVRRAVLLELIHTDLGFRLKGAEATRVESYLQRYPELASDQQTVLGLLSAEYALRRRTEPDLAPLEYEQRFPQYGPAVAERLTVLSAGEPARAGPDREGARPYAPVEPASAWQRALQWARHRPVTAGVLAVGLVAVVLLALFWWRGERRQAGAAEALVQSLMTAEVNRVPQILEELAPYRQWADPQLRRLAADSGPETRERLHAALALAAQDPGQVPYLRGRLLRAGPEELLVIRTILKPYRAGLQAPLWEVCQDPNASRERRLRAACALAAFDPDSKHWPAVSKDVAAALVHENLLVVGRWTEALRPVRDRLVDPLVAIFRDRTHPETHRAVVTSVLADYAADRPDLLAGLVLEADQREYPTFLEKLLPHKQRAARLMEAELDRELTLTWGDPPLDKDLPDPEPGLVRQVEAAGGVLSSRFAFCQTLPLPRLEALATELGRCGYRPTRLRPYLSGKSLQAAVLWRRDGRDWHVVVGLSAADLRTADAEGRQKGFLLVDLAAYEEGTERYTALWVKAPPSKEARLYLGVAEPQHAAASKPLDQAGFSPMTLHALLLSSGSTRYCSVWHKGKIGWDNAWGFDEPGFAGLHGDKVPVDISLVRRTDPAVDPDPDCRYCGVWQARKGIEPAQLLGLDPVTHVKRSRELAAQGYRPAALSVVEIPALEGKRITVLAASLWYRPLVSETAHDALARRQAQAAVTLLHLGLPERVWPLLKHSPDPRLRTYLIHLLSPLGADPMKLADRLGLEQNLSVKRALVLSLGVFGDDKLSPGARRPLAAELLQIYRDHPDPGLHSAAEWLLRRWGYEADLGRIDDELAGRPAGNRQWYMTREGHTLAMVPAGREVLMGSLFREAGRSADNETPHRKRIPRAFAIATKEVTVAQFRRFLEANPALVRGYGYLKKFSPVDEGPAINVTWFLAAQYCNWLSKQEGIPEDQWCYPTDPAEIKDGMQLTKDYLKRTGYRLPTEAEWEYACRAGAATSRFHGAADALLKEYGWYSKTSGDERTSPVGRFKPNDLGLFDMLGNVMEWCQDRALRYRPARRGQALDDAEEAEAVVDEGQPRVLRGGSFDRPAGTLRSAWRLFARPVEGPPGSGFRVARTHR
jgi:formylglycine-generating enzyme required for sulfatase activity